jgi:hypothetical protein
MSVLRQPYIERSPSMQIMARRVDLRESFSRTHTVPDNRQRLASLALIVSSLTGLALALIGHL